MNMELDLDGIFRNNDTYDYDEDYEYKEDFDQRASDAVLIPLLYSVELVIGLLGNGLLLAVLAQKRQSWRISDTFILHLSVTDILLLLTLPLWAAQAALQSGWCFKGFLCKISGAIFNINFYCGIFLLVCISINHYLSIIGATRLYSQNNPRLVHISCLSVWLVSLTLALPDCIFMAVTKSSEKLRCDHSFPQSDTDWKLVSRLLHHTLGFLLPAGALIACCCCILLRLQRRTKSLQKKRAIMVILPLVVVFFLCWMPYNITLMVDTFRGGSKKSVDVLSGNPEQSLNKALMVTSGLACLHACLRPLLYLGLCGNFRKRMLAMLTRAAVESEDSLWELGVGEEAPPDQNHEAEELKQMTSVDHQVQSTQC
ncbi:C-X-C chemokine receptor type 3-like [Plectropomus leopardus]|uniref:C-X-C chemokine receptor type 3-like n=1 Tax=Plectropomus leopardus TaxID=160734 RepID=UPI001C4D78E8|nr:C-X-C chemokine receptor type 3-like [Plectropomus leopardus]